MIFLKLIGRIVTVTASLIYDKAVITNIQEDIAYGEGVKYSAGKQLFSETGLLTDDTFGYKLELVEIEEMQPGETLLKFIRLEDTNTFFVYPRQYLFENGEHIVYRLEEFRGSLYAEIPNLFFEDFDIRDMYIGELILDEHIGYGGILSRFYYVPIEEALDISGEEVDRDARLAITNMLKNGKTKELDYYKLNIELVEGAFVYHVVRNKDGELFNDWVV